MELPGMERNKISTKEEMEETNDKIVDSSSIGTANKNNLQTKPKIASPICAETVVDNAQSGSAAGSTNAASSESAPMPVENNAPKTWLPARMPIPLLPKPSSDATTADDASKSNGTTTSLPGKSLPAATVAANSCKRKSTEIDSLSGNNAQLIAKKVRKESFDRPPIQPFQEFPGEQPIEKPVLRTKTVEPSSSSKTAAEKNGTTQNKASDDFVTIKIGPTETGKMEKEINATNPSSSSSSGNDKNTSCDEILSQYTKFQPLQGMNEVHPLKPLTTSEKKQLENLFEFDKRKGGKTWEEDWFGVVDLCNTEIPNPDGRVGERQKKRSLLDWVGMNTSANGKKSLTPTNNSLKLLNNLLRHVYNYKKVSEQAKLILANIDPKDSESIGDAIHRLSIDPIVLRQDGWTTTKAKEPQGVSGGSYRIGERIWWNGYPGVVIAFVHDDDYGDLWKGIWIEDLATFDLEREELEDARKKYIRKEVASTEKKRKQESQQKRLKTNFHVDGIEHGIVLATSYARGARHGVFWPARVMHASELSENTRRNKSRKMIGVVFLAPYWNSDQTSLSNAGRRTEPTSDSMARHGEGLFKSGPLFEIDSIDANASCIQSYPYDAQIGLDVDALRSSFKFMGLPKAAFPRFLDSQRLALGFKAYSQNALKSTRATESVQTSAALLEGHPLAVQAAHFPISVLQLPYVHMLSQLPDPERQPFPQSNSETATTEPVLRFDKILNTMKPPFCWGLGPSAASQAKETPQLSSFISSPITFLDKSNGSIGDPYNIGRFLEGLLSLQSILSEKSATSRMLKNNLNELVGTFAKKSSLLGLQSEARKRSTKMLNRTWVVVKVSLSTKMKNAIVRYRY